MTIRFLKRIWAGVLLLFISGVSHAALIAPAGLNTGDKFHLIFVTSGTTDAYSADIATYNAFVQATADAAGIGSAIGLTDWRVLGSTPTVNAADNLASIFNNQTNVPIYNIDPSPTLVDPLNGIFNNIVANSLTDLWVNGSTNNILYEEDGTPNYGNVWTGTTPSGNAYPNLALGSSTGFSSYAFPYNTESNIYAGYTNQFIQWHLYGVSQELIVLENGNVALSAVPVPAAVWLFGTGLLSLIGMASRKKCSNC
ncbi:hypothetical protein SCL_2029 [Sulfuricaulis limicola]|uniref:PEP-CTERM protein-sorting domain-containing protein n=1 Tax=Sulfuricaulis limicola TaxID=1620215 RepID=A0A1B4XHN4_9GAMM|nr:VPLPA-CTERM sorting domain-containing protein [Sulfuricaulis limicola]BAV34320.1 hypothetical protein SCL_2029 [Sulfuricaulis limicola]